MLRVFPKEPVGLLRRQLHVGGQIPVRCPEPRRRTRFHNCSGSRSVARPAVRSRRASAASFVRSSCDAPNCRAQCSSSCSSSRSQRPTRSCSSAGRVASFAIAVSSVRVMGQVYETGMPGPNRPRAARRRLDWPPAGPVQDRPAALALGRAVTQPAHEPLSGTCRPRRRREPAVAAVQVARPSATPVGLRRRIARNVGVLEPIRHVGERVGLSAAAAPGSLRVDRLTSWVGLIGVNLLD